MITTTFLVRSGNASETSVPDDFRRVPPLLLPAPADHPIGPGRVVAGDGIRGAFPVLR